MGIIPARIFSEIAQMEKGEPLMEHTPTPWNADSGSVGCKYIRAEGELGQIATVHANHVANAAFIVRACNRDYLFDDVVAALEKSLAALKLASVELGEAYTSGRVVLAKVTT